MLVFLGSPVACCVKHVGLFSQSKLYGIVQHFPSPVKDRARPCLLKLFGSPAIRDRPMHTHRLRSRATRRLGTARTLTIAFSSPMRKSRQATESEGEAFRMSEPEGRVSEMYSDDRACRKGFSPGALLWVTFLRANKKGDKSGRTELV